MRAVSVLSDVAFFTFPWRNITIKIAYPYHGIPYVSFKDFSRLLKKKLYIQTQRGSDHSDTVPRPAKLRINPSVLQI